MARQKSKTCIVCGTIFEPEGAGEYVCVRCGGKGPEEAKPPVGAPGSPGNPAPETAEKPAAAASGTKKVLIVDDEPSIVLVLKSRLEKRGYAVITASDGKDGLEKAKTEKPNLIILDVLMPEMTGYQMVERLRNMREDVRDIPIVVMSARHTMREFFPSWAVVTFLPKPFDPDVMMDAVAQVIGVPEQAPSVLGPGEAAARKAKTVVMVAVEDYLFGKVRDRLESRGCRVINGVNESGAVERAREMRPDLVLGQFWDDLNTLDVTKIRAELAKASETQGIRFAAFCANHLGIDARKVMNAATVITFHSSDDLAEQVEQYLYA